MGVAQNAPNNIQSSILLLVTILFMIGAFFAGWFYMVKKAIKLDKSEFIMDEDKAKASFNLLRELPIGIGEYFLAFLGVLILYSVIFIVLAFITFKAGMHFIGDVGLSVEQIKTAMATPAGLKSVITSLSHDQLVKMNAWNFLILATVSFYSFLTMLWAPQVIYNTKNPFLSFIFSVKALFKNPLSSIVLFVYISFINFFISFINTFAAINPILYFVSMLVYFYFIVYIVVLIFLYYDREIEEKAEDYRNSGSDSFGQDETRDSDSKED